MPRVLPAIALLLATALGLGCAPPEGPAFDPGTPDDQAALFDYLLEKTMEREAFSPVKNERLDLDIEEGMRRYRG